MDQFSVALVGNPNCGKTTLFNSLTGSNHYVGNWAGVTVEKKVGQISYDKHQLALIDLPGIYSLSPYSLEEKVSRDYLLQDESDVILNIVDSSYLERNLYLTLQLIEMGKPVVLALNMMDEAERKHIKIDVDQLSEQLGIPVIPISALKQKGIKDLLSAVVEMHHHKRDYQAKVLTYSETIEAHVAKLEPKVMNDCGATKRWTALKIIEQDEDIAELSGVSLR